MNLYALLPLSGFLANIVLAAVVYARSPRDRPNRILALLCLGLAFWSVLKFTRLLVDDHDAALLLFQISGLGWAFLPSLYMHFVVAYTRRSDLPSGSWILRASHGVGLMLALACFVPGAMATHMVLGPWGYSHHPGPLYKAFAAYSLLMFVLAIGMLMRARRSATGTAERTQLTFLIIATLFPVLAASATNIWLPVLDIYVLPLGEVISTVNVALLAYAMWRHGLLGVSLEQAAEAIIGTMGDALLVVDNHGSIVLTNAATSRLLGQPKDSIVGKKLEEVVHSEKVRKSSFNVLEDVTDEVEAQLVPTQGDPVPVILSSNPVFDSTGETVGVVVCASDIRDLRRAMAKLETVNERLEHQSITDELTGVSNRRYANQRLADEFAHARRYRRRFSIGVIDLDDFKQINDTYGHQAGDRVLQSVAREIASVLRDADVVSRWGGDEFFVLLGEADEKESRVIGERMVKKIADADVEGVGQSSKVSLGLSTFDPDDPDETPNALIRRADEALYEAKRTGKGQVCQAEAHARQPTA